MTTTFPFPTTAQAASIRLLEAHPARIEGGKVQQDVPEGKRKITLGALAKMAENRWVEMPEGDGPITLASFAVQNAEDREALNFYKNLSYREQNRVRITARPLGGSPIRGFGGKRVGRNVTCRTCVHHAKIEFEQGATRRSPYEPIWFTNESNAQRDAEVVAGKHYLRHLNGDLPPFIED